MQTKDFSVTLQLSYIKMSDVSREDVKKRALAVDYVNESWKDGHWGWVVCIAAAVVQFVVLGIHNSFGILYIVFVREFGWSKALTGKLQPFLPYYRLNLFHG